MTDSDISNHGTHDLSDDPTPTMPEQESSHKPVTSPMKKSSQGESARYRRGGMIFSLVWFFIMLAGSYFMAQNAREPWAIWQESVLAVVYMIATIVALFGFTLFRRGQMKAARTWLIASAYLAIFLSAILQHGGGASILMSIIMPVGFSAGLGLLSLPSRQAKQLIYSGIGLSAFFIITSYVALPFRGSDTPSRDLGTPIAFVFILLVVILILTQARPIVLWFTNRPIRTKMIALIAGLSLLSIGILFAVNIRNTQEMLTANAVEKMLSFVDQRSDVLAEMLAGRVNTMNTFSLVVEKSPVLAAQNEGYEGTVPEIEAQIQEANSQWVNASDYDALIRRVLRNELAYDTRHLKEEFSDMFIEVFITDRYGANVAAADRTSDYYQADEDWWQAAYNDGTGAVYIGDVEYDASSDVWGFNIAVPIYSQDSGEVLGIIRTTALFDEFLNELGKGVDESANVDIVFMSGWEVGPGGQMESITDERLVEHQFTPVPYFSQETEDGENLYTATAFLTSETDPFINETEWAVALRENESTVLAPVRQQTTISILVALGVAVVIAGVASYFAQRISAPITKLTDLARELASGNYDVLAEVTTTDEVGQLSSAFNTMASEVAQRDKALVARARAAETSAEVSRSLSTILNQAQLVTEVVEQLQGAFGYYHAHMYLIDEDTQNLVMVGGTGEPGREMLAAGHKIAWGRGLTGRAAESNAAVLVPDTSQEEDWLPNPLLPETKAEIAVPIAIGDRVLGVLDVQHNEIGGLDEDDQTLLESIAGQVAIALQNIYLMAEAQNRAKRQTLIYEITQRIQGATSVKDAMQIAVREVGRALDVEETKVKLS